MAAEHDPWHLPEGMSDLEKIQRGIQHAEIHGIVIDDATARRIAMGWHGGQNSPLYSLGSSGAIDQEKLLSELTVCYRDIPDLKPEEQESSTAQIKHILKYVTAKGNRPPIPGWHLLTTDNAPPIVYIEPPADEALPGMPARKTPAEGYIGKYASVRDVAEHLLAQTGIWQAIESCIEQCGAALSPYINIDVDRYASDLASDIHLLPTEEGEYEVYWREDES